MKQLLLVSCAVIASASCERASERRAACDVAGDWADESTALFIQARDHGELAAARTPLGMAVYPTSYIEGRRLDASHLLLGPQQCELSDDCKLIHCAAPDLALAASRHCNSVTGEWTVHDDRDADLRSARISVLDHDSLQIDLVGTKMQQRTGRLLDAFHLELYFPKGTWTCVLASCGQLSCAAPDGHVQLAR